jgi:hypothetical protein
MKKPPSKKSAVWRSSNLYASGWKIHDFASLPRDRFALIDMQGIIFLLHEKVSALVTFWSMAQRLIRSMTTRK